MLRCAEELEHHELRAAEPDDVSGAQCNEGRAGAFSWEQCDGDSGEDDDDDGGEQLEFGVDNECCGDSCDGEHDWVDGVEYGRCRGGQI